jgi:hypothetical protein
MPPVITPQGALNTTALIVPNAYIQIVPPQTNYFNGLPTNILGVVGTAPWGPVNQPVTIGSMQGYAQKFGAIQNRKYDLGTHVAVAVQQGANNFRCVRVTDGTDTAAALSLASAAGSTEMITIAGTATAGDALSVTVTSSGVTGSPVTVAYTVKSSDTPAIMAAALAAALNGNTALGAAGISAAAAGAVVTATYPTALTIAWAKTVTGAATETVTLAAGSGTTIAGLTLTSLYTGSLGNQAQVTVSNGSNYSAANPTYKLTIAMPGLQEVFDNLGGSGAALWQAMANAVNNGQSAIRGPSQLVVAAAGGASATPVIATSSLAGGTDGAGTVSAATLVGQNTLPYKGLYTLQGQGVSVAWLADADDSTQWANQLAFGVANGVYMIGVTPAGDTISNAITAKQNAGIDSPWWKHLFGDWVYWQDSANNVLRLVSPQGFIGGLLGNLSPQNSTLNKPLQGIVGTQKTSNLTGVSGAYTQADLQNLIGAGIDVIANPCPGGSYFGAQSGHNSSSDATRNGDNYTRLTDYIAQSLGAASGKFVGQLQTQQQQLNVKAAIGAFFQSMQDAGQIGTSTGTTAYKVNLPGAQSSPARIALGYEDCDVFVTYLSVVEKFLVNFQGGQSVVLPASANQNA